MGVRWAEKGGRQGEDQSRKSPSNYGGKKAPQRVKMRVFSKRQMKTQRERSHSVTRRTKEPVMSRQGEKTKGLRKKAGKKKSTKKEGSSKCGKGTKQEKREEQAKRGGVVRGWKGCHKKVIGGQAKGEAITGPRRTIDPDQDLPKGKGGAGCGGGYRRDKKWP